MHLAEHDLGGAEEQSEQGVCLQWPSESVNAGPDCLGRSIASILAQVRDFRTVRFAIDKEDLNYRSQIPLVELGDR